MSAYEDAIKQETAFGFLAVETPVQKPDNFAGGILAEAQKIVTGDRSRTHGDKERSFQLIANLWNAYLDGRKRGGPITPGDVAHCMALLKIARSVQGQPVRDHYLDAAAYCSIAGELSI